MSDFPFNIEEVASLLDIKYRRKYSYAVDVDCPFCGDTKGHLNINFKKNTWNCLKCGESGGMLDLYARIHNTSTKGAYKDICNELGIFSSKEVEKRKLEKAEEIKSLPEEGNRPNFKKIHIVYNSLLNNLYLSDDHRKNLQKRGLDDDFIALKKYKTMPVKSEVKKVMENIKKETNISDFSGVPGFYIEDGEWTFNFSSSGFIIPVRNSHGNIVGAQIRSDENKVGAKYIALSSRYKPSGTKATSMVHVVGEISSNTKRVFLTEGVLKGDVANYLSGYPFISVQGVNNQKHIGGLLKKLKEIGVEEIAVAFDMDRYQNENVMKAVNKVTEVIKENDLIPISVAWDSNFKGIDDFFLNKHL